VEAGVPPKLAFPTLIRDLPDESTQPWEEKYTRRLTEKKVKFRSN